jgi:hypothetical protein
MKSRYDRDSKLMLTNITQMSGPNDFNESLISVLRMTIDCKISGNLKSLEEHWKKYMSSFQRIFFQFEFKL